ncbi:Zinc/iron permease [Tricharina praecox]|uniref:Zinc/iron permease n=1 Tax=Tricharina praecox TaxID=43433 RepID=UPI002220CDDC|nr:Zinc/iron permease [Tricharina praecox]KAI5846912.1 Zinc/iron permease [Tricharina praecox]
MNCPTRDTNPYDLEGHNQNPPLFPPELTTRSSLVCGGKTDGVYNLPLHVLALFIILAVSVLACSFPLVVKKAPQLRVPHYFLFLSRHFGTGVLIATAFVHLLPTAFTSLTDPCLPKFWNEGYPAMAGLIAMASVFVVVSIEMFFSTMNGGAMGGCHGGPSAGYEVLTPTTASFGHRRGASSASAASFTNGGRNPPSEAIRPVRRTRRSNSIGSQLQRIELSADVLQYDEACSDGEDSPDPEAHHKSDYEDDDADSDDANEVTELRSLNSNGQKMSTSAGHTRRPGGGRLTEEQQQKKNLLQVMLLEAGILFHSVFIGMALSVATGSNFIVLLIAITFHQTFEGLALGSRIAGITAFAKDSPKPWLMCLAYGTTTPIGQAIGLLTRNLYDPASQTGLLMVGVMNAISSGLLLFAGLVELLAEDFLSDESYVILTGKRRLQACAAVAAGAAGMALVGAWA